MATASPHPGALPASNNDSGPLPFTPEYQLIPEGGTTNHEFDCCDKHPGHPTFIPVQDFTVEHLPEGLRTDRVMEWIKTLCDRTVRLEVGYVSLHRPDKYLNSDIRGSYEYTLYGTGFVEYWHRNIEVTKKEANKRCPCRECKTSDDPKVEYVEMKIVTAKHVVFDSSEAEHTNIELFYDSDDRSNVITCYGVEVEWDSLHRDTSHLMCVSHDMSLCGKLSRKLNIDLSNEPYFPVIVSHPHGVSKRISMGSFYKTVSKVVIPTDKPFIFTVKSGSRCRLCKNHWATSLESFQDLVASDTPCQPGVLYGVREGMEMSCNPSTCWLDRDRIGKDRHNVVRFASDVEFRFANGNDSKSFPDVEFKLDLDEWRFLSGKKVEMHFEYDMDTCPGSSGASPCAAWLGLWPHGGNDRVKLVSRTGRRIYKKRR